MKLKTDFVLHSVGGEHVVVAVGDRLDELNGMIRLNDTAAFLWERLAVGEDASALVSALEVRYGIDAARAREAVDAFLGRLSDAGVLEP